VQRRRKQTFAVDRPPEVAALYLPRGDGSTPRRLPPAMAHYSLHYGQTRSGHQLPEKPPNLAAVFADLDELAAELRRLATAGHPQGDVAGVEPRPEPVLTGVTRKMEP
jgi:hypothetical protein